MRQRPTYLGHSATAAHVHPVQRQLRLRSQTPGSAVLQQRQAFFSSHNNGHHDDVHEPVYVAQNPRFRLPAHLTSNYRLKPGWMTSIDQAQEMIGFLQHNEMRPLVPIHELEALDCEEVLAHYLKETQQEKGRLMYLSVEKGVVLEGRYPTFGLHLLTYLCRRDQFKILEPVSIEKELEYAVSVRQKMTASQLKF